MKTYCEPARNIPIAGEYDVIVAGGGPAGVCAAIAAARNGSKTLVVEQASALGGMMTSGLVIHLSTFRTAEGPPWRREDRALRRIVGGIAKEITERVCAQDAGAEGGGRFDFEPEAMKRVLDAMVEEAGVTVLYYTLVVDAIVENRAVKGIIAQNKTGRCAMLAKQVVDCTGDADVAVKAGAGYDQGREGDGLCQPATLVFRIGGVDWKRLQEYRATDKGLQRFCQKATELGLMTPFQTEVMGFWFFGGRPDQLGVNFTNMKNVDSTNTEQITQATVEGRRQARMAETAFRRLVPGMENCYVMDTAPYLGVRESRRIHGLEILTIEDVIGTRKSASGIAKGSFPIDIHSPDRTGFFNLRWLPENGYYDIPYGCIVPKGLDDLTVAGRCISATHEALASVRVMYQCMALGQAAGTAAAICAAQGIHPRELVVGELRERLAAQGALVGSLEGDAALA